MTELTILTISPRGKELARRICKELGYGSIVDAADSAEKTVQKTFRKGRPMVCVMPLGAVVRGIAGAMESNITDPPVVVVDEAGKFAVSVLGGHGGAANQLALQVASAIAATPVITTSAEVLQFPAVDLLGRQWGWKLETKQNLPRVAAAVAQAEPVAVYQDAGQSEWWKPFGPWPHHFERLTSWPTESRWRAFLAISDRVLPPVPTELEPVALVYRPPSLTLGISCRRGISRQEIEDSVTVLFERHGLSPACITAVASASFKKNEAAVIDFAERRQIPFLTYATEKFKLVGRLPTPSERVQAKLGVAGVCEPAAMLAAGVLEVVVPKTRFRRLSLAVARRPLG